MTSYPMDVEAAARLNIRAEARVNNAFMRVIHTGEHEQIVVMTLPPDGETGRIVHVHTDQLLVFVDGVGEAQVGTLTLGVEEGDLDFVGAGTPHKLINRAVTPLRMITVFSPPVLPHGTVSPTQETARPLDTGRPAASPSDLPAWFAPPSPR